MNTKHTRAALVAVTEVKIGQNRGTPRIWLQGSKLERSSFAVGARFTVLKETGKLVLTLSRAGGRVVSKKKVGGKLTPVIDLNSAELLETFEGSAGVRVICQHGQIIVLLLVVEWQTRERLARLARQLARGVVSMGSLSHGGGVLTNALHAGFAKAGVRSRLAFANEIRDELLEQAAGHNGAWDESTISLGVPLQNLAFDPWAMKQLPAVEVLEAGLPCSGASVAGRAKRGLKLPEDHPEVGHLAVGFLAVIAKVQPAVIVLENVPQYESTASMAIIRSSLRDMGYAVSIHVLDGADWNALEHRKRICMVALTRGLTLDWSELRHPLTRVRQIGEVLDAVAPDAACWSEMAGLKAKEKRDRAAGKGFAMQLVSASDTKCPTITKGYAKVRSTDPKLTHPSNPSLLRQFTPTEHARMKGIPPELVEGLAQTTAHELLGQSICYEPFLAVGELIGNVLATAGKAVAAAQPSCRQAA